VTSVTAFGGSARRTSAQSRFRVVIHSTAPRTSVVTGQAALRAVQHEPGAERLGQEQRVAGLRPDFGQTPSGCTVPTTASPYFGSRSRIVWPPARIAPAARTCASARRGSRDGLLRQLLRELGDREGQQRPPAHREHVVEGVRRRDRPEVARVVDERREEVEREDERRLVVER
jgi:hypothetical protein